MGCRANDDDDDVVYVVLCIIVCRYLCFSFLDMLDIISQLVTVYTDKRGGGHSLSPNGPDMKME